MKRIKYFEQIWTANKDKNGGYIRYEGSEELVRVNQEEFEQLQKKQWEIEK